MHRLVPLLVVLVACSEGSDPGGTPTLTINPLLDSVFVGDTIAAGSLVAVYRDAQGQVLPTPSLRWRSATLAVLSVDSLSGRTIALARGQGVVEAVAGDGTVGQAAVVVSNPLDIALLVDTVFLMPGDTFTVPVSVVRRGGSPPPARFAASLNPGVYTIDTITGRITAVATGSPTRLVARADTVADTGGVHVMTLSDTVGGRGFFTVSGAVTRRAGVVARAVNYRRQGDTLSFRLNFAISSGGQVVENVVVTLRSPVTAPGTFAVDSITPAEAFGTGSDFICRPTRPWGLWSIRTPIDLVALSYAGTIGITRVTTVTNGQAISGSFFIETRHGVFYDDPLARLALRGTFVAPLIADNRPCGG